MKLLLDYVKSLEAIYAHVGFEPDWVVYPISIRTLYFWNIVDGKIKYAETEEELETESGEYFESDVYTQRFYEKWTYPGENFTMVFEDTHTDGMKYFAIFDNSKHRPGKTNEPMK